MNSVAPSCARQRLRSARVVSVGERELAAGRRGCPGPAAAAGRAAAPAAAARRPASPASRRAARPAPRPRASRAARRAKSRVLHGQLRQRRRRRRPRTPRTARRSRATKHAHATTRRRRCGAVHQQHVLARPPARSRRGAQERPAGEVERTRPRRPPRAAAPRLPRPGGQRPRGRPRAGGRGAAGSDDLHRLAVRPRGRRCAATSCRPQPVR